MENLYGRVLKGNAASEKVLTKSGYEFLTCEASAPDDPYGHGMLVYRLSAVINCGILPDVR